MHGVRQGGAPFDLKLVWAASGVETSVSRSLCNLVVPTELRKLHVLTEYLETKLANQNMAQCERMNSTKGAMRESIRKSLVESR